MRISPLLDGVRTLSGEKIQWYLAAELRDRIRQTGVRISIVDRLARKQYAVEPRQYEGRLLHQLPTVPTPLGDIYVELYLHEPGEANRVALYRRGTRVIDDLTLLDHLARAPWNARSLQGHLDAPFLELTPGTRAGIIQDSAYMAFCEALAPLEQKLIEIIEAQRRAEEEKASREQLRTIQRAFREALLALPAEEYDWFDISAQRLQSAPQGGAGCDLAEIGRFDDAPEAGAPEPTQTGNGSSSNFRAPCSASRFRQPRVSFASALARNYERCRAIAHGDGSTTTWNFIGKSPRALARSPTSPARQSPSWPRRNPA